MRRINKKKIIATATAVTLAFSVPVCNMSVYAAEKQPEKEENVYVKLQDDGSVDQIYVVNEFALDQDGTIIDYGDYDSVRNLTTEDEIEDQNGKITVKAAEGKFYYQGNLKGKELPWNIGIHYYLDGKEISANEVAGQTGKLTIKLSFKENKNADEDFFQNYFLQATAVLDTEKCQNIKAEGATQANVGKTKQLTYMILSGKEGEYEITADVMDFSMDPITINGVPLSLDIDSDDLDTEALTDRIGDIQDAVAELDDGTGTLKDGSSALVSGAGTLKTGTDKLESGSASLKTGGIDLSKGADSLETGLKNLEKGSATLKKGMKELSSNTKNLTDGSDDFKEGMNQLNTALKEMDLNISSLKELTEGSSKVSDGLSDLVNGLNGISKSFSEGDIKTLKEKNESAAKSIRSTVAEYSSLLSKVNGIIASLPEDQQKLVNGLLSANGVDISNAQSELSKLGQVADLLEANNTAYESLKSGIDSAKTGAQTLNTQYAKLDNVIQQLPTMMSEMVTNLNDLKEGIDLLTTKYESLDEGIDSYTTAFEKIAAGYESLDQGVTTATAGAQDLSKGSKTLKNGINSLDEGIQSLASGADTLYKGTQTLDSGVSELKDGTETFKDETKDADQEVEDTIDETIEDLAGSDYEPKSFVSSDNTNVDSVQFVMTTNKIEKEEAVEEEVPEEDETWLDKLKNLF
ncbi:MAG: hypothetical protein Q4B70_02765 [Lachnospiraceae bacterium]|nr:hypothetical protein [Lachnospiraceae bacterium]